LDGARDGTLVSQLAGATTTRYTQDLASPLSQILSDGTSTYVYGMDRLYGEVGIIRSWYTADALGSVRTITSNAGIASASASYDPYGQLQSGSVGSFGFTGELQQGSSVYLRARWYNASTGTLFGRDPFEGYSEAPYSLMPYQYGYANPVSNTDPSGRITEPPDETLNRCDPTSMAVESYQRVRKGMWNNEERHLTKCLKPLIMKYAAIHAMPGYGFDGNTFAATMAAIIRMENGNRSRGDFVNRTAGNVCNQLGGLCQKIRGTDGDEASTGVANIRPSVVMEIYSCAIPWSDPLGGSGEFSFSFQTSYITRETIAERLQDPRRYIQPGVDFRGKFDKSDTGWISQLLQDNEFSIEMLAINMKRGILRAFRLRLQPTVFNVAAWHNGGIQHPEFIRDKDDVKGYAAAVAYGFLEDAAKDLRINLPPTAPRWSVAEAEFIAACKNPRCSP
jgi:RHS repeat-associated protein